MTNPPWVLLRGLARSYTHWQDFPTQVEQGLQTHTIACDLPGAGKLNHITCPTDMSEVVKLIRAQPNITDQPVNLLGLSLGGMIALQWAHEFPDEINHLVIINSSSRDSGHFWQRLTLQSMQHMLGIVCSRSSINTEKHILQMVSNRYDNDIQKTEQLAAISDATPITRMNILRQLCLAARFTLPKTLRCPMLVLSSAQDHMVNPACSAAIAKHYNALQQQHKTAGHDLPCDEPQWVIDSIAAAHW